MSIKNEQYFTPENFTIALLQHVPVLAAKVFEPSSGDGSIAKTLERYENTVITNDIDDDLPADFHFDATYRDVWKMAGEGIDWVVTNPPFSAAHHFMKLGYEHAKVGVALLLRLSFLEPCDGRDSFLALNPPHKIIVLPRYSFTQDGHSDSVTCAWMIWFKEPHKHSIEKPISVVPREWLGMLGARKASTPHKKKKKEEVAQLGFSGVINPINTEVEQNDQNN
jgi:hypothetical protein